MQELSRSSSAKEEISEDRSLKETHIEDFSFEYGLPGETLPKDLSSEDDFSDHIPVEDLSLEDDFSQEELADTNWSDDDDEDAETTHLGHTMKSSLRAALEWCDEVANRQDDFITNFKSHLPFVVVVFLAILLLWALRIFYG